VINPAGFNVDITDRYDPVKAADLLIEDNNTRLDSPRLQRLVRRDESCKRGLLRMRDWILEIAAVGGAYLYRRYRVKSRKSTRSLIDLKSW
jgi:hypothetical protein